MAKDVSVKLKLIDEMTQKLDSMASSGDRALNSFTSAGDKADEAFSRMSSNADNVSSSMGTAADASEQYATSGDRAAESLEKQADSAGKAGDELNEFGDEAKEAGNEAEQFGQKSANAAEMAATAFIAAGLTNILKGIWADYQLCDEAADEFETSLAKLSTIADPTAASLEDLSGQMKTLSNETGVAVADLAESAYSAISASVDTAKSVEFVAQANKLALGGFTETSTAVDVLTTALNAYGLEAEAAARVSDVLVQTQNLGKTTVGELASSMGNIIPTAAAYGVEIEQLGAAYAKLTANGINTHMATTSLNRLLLELADSGSAAAEVLEEVTGKSFTELIETGSSLGDVIAILGESVDNDTVAFSNLWQSAQAGKAALSLMNTGADEFNTTLDAMRNSAGSTEDAFNKMANTGEMVEKKFKNAINNLTIAIGNAQPSLDGLMVKTTGLIEKLTEFVEEHPKAVAALDALAIALGAVAAAAVLLTIKANILTPAMEKLAIACAANPYILAAAAVAGLAAAIVVLTADDETAIDKAQILTDSSQQLADEIERQKQIVEETSAKYGEMSGETQIAKDKLEELENQFENSRTTISEFNDKVDDMIEGFHKSRDAFQESMTELDKNSDHARALADELEKLEGQSDKTAAEQEREAAIVNKLNEIYPELGLQYDKVSDSLNKSANSVKEYVAVRKQQLELELRAEREVQAKLDWEDALKAKTEALKNMNRAQEEYNELVNNAPDPSDYYSDTSALDAYNAKMAIAKQNAEESVEKYRLLTNEEQDLHAEFLRMQGASEELANSMAENTSATEENAEAMKQAEEEAAALAEEYKELYDAALEAAQGTITLFEAMDTESKMNSQTAIENLKSQKEAWEGYTENLKALANSGIAKEVFEQISDGSADSMKIADEWAKGLESSNEKVRKSTEDNMMQVTQLLQDVTKATEDYATTTATALNGDNLDSMSEKIAESAKASEEAASKQEQQAQALEKSAEAGNKAADAMGTTAEKTAKTGEKAKEASDNVDEMSSKLEKVPEATETAASALEEMNSSTEENMTAVQETVTSSMEEVNESLKSIEETQESFENTMQAINDSVASGMDQLVQKVTDAIAKLNMQEAAGNAAKKTFEAYLTQMKSYGSQIVAEANSIASQVQAALSSASASMGGVGHNATGTTYSEPVYIAGEYGPELIIGSGGDTVFPASETAKIMNALMSIKSEDSELMPPDAMMMQIQEVHSTDENTSTQNINHTIKLEGKGGLDIGQSVSKQDLIKYMYTELEPILMQIIAREIMEEGDTAYDF